MYQPNLMSKLVLDKVHVWHIQLDRDAYLDDELLSDSELRRMGSYSNHVAATQFGAVRCCLRILLGAYLEEEPGGLEFGITITGRPFLKTASRKSLRFNVTHSGQSALIAVGNRCFGIDVEEEAPQADLEPIVDLVFSDRERRVLQSVELNDRATRILRGWTRKEAVAKALGVGFLIDPREISVALDESQMTSATVRQRWTLNVADVSFPGHFAALAGPCISTRPRIRAFPAENEVHLLFRKDLPCQIAQL